jgi:general secretion pathway protein L
LLFNRVLAFFSWWQVGLAAWLPDKWRERNRQRAYIQCDYTTESLTFRRIARLGEMVEEKQFSVDAVLAEQTGLQKWLSLYPEDDVVLCVAQEKVLSKVVTLPIQARENLSAVIHFEIDRQTPFKPEQVYINYLAFESDKDEITFSVLLSVVPKQSVSEALALLQQLTISPSRLLLQSPKGTESQITLSEKAPRKSKGFTLNTGLACLAFVLLLTTLYQPLFHYDSLSESMEPALTQAKKQAAQVSALKRENDAILEQLQYVEGKLADYRQRVIILNELAMVLPAHTWLERSEIKDRTMTIRGESEAASDLISLLTETGHYDDVHFSAPTTHNDKSGKERFQIEAVIGGGASDKLN